MFEEIDEAYKSISSPLRRYLFKEFGLPALRILEEVPDYFQEYDVEQIRPNEAKVMACGYLEVKTTDDIPSLLALGQLPNR